MGRNIIKLPCDGADYYLEWSSVVDAPVTDGMLLEEFEAYYCCRYGHSSMDGLVERLARVNETGTSDMVSREDVTTWLVVNRAGDNERRLTVDEIVDKYIRQSRKDKPDA